MDSTDSCTIDLTDSDISILTPVVSPGVLDKVVVSSVRSAVSDSENGMVKLGTTVSVGDDTLHVVLEWVGSGTYSHCDWLLSDGSLEFRNAIPLNSGVIRDLDLSSEWREAAIGDASVWVFLLSNEVVPHSVLEAVSLQTTVATLRMFVTIDTLLLS